jgi:hypothetical protein
MQKSVSASFHLALNKYSGDLNTECVQILNGQKLYGLGMVWFLNGILGSKSEQVLVRNPKTAEPAKLGRFKNCIA